MSNHSNGLSHTSRIRTARLSTMTRSRAVHYRSMVTQCTAEVCGLRTRRLADADPQ